MPIYEYQCEQCSHQLEILQKISDPQATDCPECGKPALKKLVSAAGFVLKGNGWYETDFKNKPKKGADKAGSTDSKPAAKTESKAASGSSSSSSSD